MPKKKITPEELLHKFQEWKTSPEFQGIEEFQAERNNMASKEPIELGTDDINDDWQPFLDKLLGMAVSLKVPGRKAKLYEQQYIRTMFFQKVETITIDGIPFTLTMEAKVELWNCKEALVNIYNKLEDTTMSMELTENTYVQWRKDLIKLIKEWDKWYLKHQKSRYKEMAELHKTCMTPLTNLWESNFNFTNLEIIEKKAEVPKFRHEALEIKFCEHMTTLCYLFTTYGDLKDPYNIKQQLNVLKTDEWQIIPPLAFYFNPLLEALTEVRKELLEQRELGHLRSKYFIEKNESLQKKVIHMVKMDMKAQWLAGDELKQDQFKFIYQTMKIIYDSPIREFLIQDDQAIIDTVIPEMCAYQAVLVIRNILDVKMDEKKKEQEKAEREGKKVTFEDQQIEEEKKGILTEEQIYKKRIDEKLNVSQMSYFSEAQKERELQKQEIERYGRFWVWEGYIDTKQKDIWLQAAEKLYHINEHVRQDIEDFILLKGYQKKNIKSLQKHIEDFIAEQRMKAKNRAKDAEEEDKIEDKRRGFLNKMRPPFCWNFFEDSEIKTDHVLRPEADPKQCYIDGRIQLFMEDIERLGYHLKKYQEENWKLLRSYTSQIFKDMIKHENDSQ